MGGQAPSAATRDDPIEGTLHRLAELHDEHTRIPTALQRGVQDVTDRLARPRWVLAIILAVGGWAVGNLLLGALGRRAPDAFPFPALAVTATVASFLTTLLVLATQYRDSALDKRRSQLTLQLVVIVERKVAKLLALLEEQRRDSAVLPDREDPEAARLAQTIDPGEVVARMDRLFDREGARE